MHTDFLIVGQGISGTWLSYYLLKEGRSVLVVDNNDQHSSSRIAAGIINPVTGRRHVEVWMADEVLPFARNAYAEIGTELGIEAISEKTLIDFFPDPQMRQSFIERVNEKQDYVFEFEPPEDLVPVFNYEFGAGEIKPVYLAHLESLLPAWRTSLKKNNQLLEEEFEFVHLKLKDQISYKDITASYIIFCEGYESNVNPFFSLLPFAPNKGELLIAEIPDLQPGHIYKKGMMLVPYSTPGLWWVGSNYHWEFDHHDPTKEFREKAEELLTAWLKVPFTITSHLAGIRPATLERRPFVGFHPDYMNVGILNGMGTKGCSLAPFFAKQLTDFISSNKPITPEADINRFRKILSKSAS